MVQQRIDFQLPRKYHSLWTKWTNGVVAVIVGDSMWSVEKRLSEWSDKWWWLGWIGLDRLDRLDKLGKMGRSGSVAVVEGQGAASWQG